MMTNKQFYKLILLQEYVNNNEIISYLALLYYIIEDQHDKLTYIYHNLLHLTADNFIYRLLDNLNINLLSFKYDQILIYDNGMLEKFMYIIVMAIKKNINNMDILVNKYLSHVIQKGNKYVQMHASILSLHMTLSHDILLNYDYHDGLILSLKMSSKWNDTINFFYNKIAIYSCQVFDIFVHTIKLLYNYRHNRSDLIDDVFRLSKRIDVSFFSMHLDLYYERDEVIDYIYNNI